MDWIEEKKSIDPKFPFIRGKKNIIDRIDNFTKYIRNSVYNMFTMDKLLKCNEQHIHNIRKNIVNYGELSMKDEYFEVVWKEGDNNLEFIKRKMLKEYSHYPFAGNYEIDPDILDPELLELICLNLDKEE